jgi:tRNA(fMet)-specific endonuclease VapC
LFDGDGLHDFYDSASLGSTLKRIAAISHGAAAARPWSNLLGLTGLWKRPSRTAAGYAGDYDRMIAAQAISSHSILVTNNLADFSDIPGLSMENWMV